MLPVKSIKISVINNSPESTQEKAKKIASQLKSEILPLTADSEQLEHIINTLESCSDIETYEDVLIDLELWAIDNGLDFVM
jgi:hypothetical protein